MLVSLDYVKKQQKQVLEDLIKQKGYKYQEYMFNVPMWLVLSLQSDLGEIISESYLNKPYVSLDNLKSANLKDKLIDFLADLGTLANILQVDLEVGVEGIQEFCIESQINQLTYRLTTLPWKKQFARSSLLNYLLPGYVKLVYAFGFDIKDIEEGYKEKYK